MNYSFSYPCKQNCDYHERHKGAGGSRCFSLKDVIFEAAASHEALLALLLIGAGIFLMLSPPVQIGPVGRLFRDGFPQMAQGAVILTLGLLRLYGVMFRHRLLRIYTGCGAATVWLSFFLMSVGSVPPTLGSVIYFWLALNSIIVVYRIGDDN